MPTSEQEEIARAAADLVAQQLPTSELRARTDEPDAVSSKAWQACAEMGLLALGLPAAVGGAGCAAVEETLLFRELGRHVAPGPFLSTVLGGHLALAAGDAELAGRIAAGSVRVAYLEPARGQDGMRGQRPDVAPEEFSGDAQLRDWAGAELALLLSPVGAGLVSVEALGEIKPCVSIDPGVRIAEVRAERAPLRAWAPTGQRDLHTLGLLLVAAQLVGIAQACRDMSVHHAKTREQFGRPIGVNQAIKHRCADMALAAERADAQLLFAAASYDAARADTEFQVRSAKLAAADAARSNAASNVQVHGGMGWTSEFDAHLFVERAEVLENTLATRTESLAVVLDLPAPQ